MNVCDYEKANNLYNDFVKIVKQDFDGKVSTGIFGANMKIKLVNNGPLTFFIDTINKE